MELELSLSLPVHDSRPMKGFDLNSHNHGQFKEQDNINRGCHADFNNNNNRLLKQTRRCFAGEGGGDRSSETLFPLVSWNGDPNEDDDDDWHIRKKPSSYASYEDDGERRGIIGWPPVNSWRKKLINEHQNQGVVRVADVRVVDENIERGMNMIMTNSIFVKVKMEGVAIARMININLYHSYQMLINTLIHMFAHCQEVDKDGERFNLWYQDKEGVWLLAGEVPWQTFVDTVQRMEVVRNGDGS